MPGVGAGAFIAPFEIGIGLYAGDIGKHFRDSAAIQRLDFGQPHLSNPVLKIHHGSAAVQFVDRKGQQGTSDVGTESFLKIIKQTGSGGSLPGSPSLANLNIAVAPGCVGLCRRRRELFFELSFRDQFLVAPIPLAFGIRRETFNESLGQADTTVFEEATHLNLGLNIGPLFLHIPCIAVSADVDATDGVLGRHECPIGSGGVNDSCHDRCLHISMYLL